MQNKIVPSIWFGGTGGSMAPILEYYENIFGAALTSDKIISLGDTPSGKTEFCNAYLFGQKYILMSTDQAHADFNDAFSLTLECDDQAEIDKYWNYFTKEGKEVQCGWCTDKYGMRWQVIPKNLDELLNSPEAWNVMMGQKKIVISEYIK